MTDRLREFIKTHREEFDDELPPVLRMEKISGPFKRRNRLVNRISSSWMAAAVMIVAIMTAGFFIFKPRQEKKEQSSYSDPIERTDPAYALQISQIRQVIGLQQEELKKLEKEYPDLYNQFSSDIASLDSAYQALKGQLVDHPSRETLLEAMISNLRLQTELLTRQLNIIRQIKQQNNSHEKVRT